MTTRGVGIDAVDVARFARVIARRPRLLTRLFTDQEIADSKGAHERLAARFAAKEALMKALGLGMGSLKFRDIEVRRAATGQPSLVLHGDAARRRGDDTALHLSLTHTAQVASAIVIAEQV
jgi:holo-[acyl-carrier protein] synthase